MRKKTYSFISIMLSFLMFFSLFSPELVKAAEVNDDQEFEVIDYIYLESNELDGSDQMQTRLAPLIPIIFGVVVRQGSKMIFKKALKNGTKKITIRNGHLANKKHPVTNVKFNNKGFPIFTSSHTYKLPKKYFKSTNKTQFKYANQSLKADLKKNPKKYKFTASQKKDIQGGKTPNGYVWHHHENPGNLQLVKRTTHEKTGHTGGRTIWGS